MKSFTNRMKDVSPYACLMAAIISLAFAQKVLAQDTGPSDAVEMERVSVEGGELEYEVRGDGEPVLLVHGAMIAGSFLPLMDKQSLANYRLIRYHRRGFAGSTAPDGPDDLQVADAVALLAHLGVDRAHVVGHSGGADIALHLVYEHPEVVHSLVLLEPPDVGQVPSRTIFRDEVIAPATRRYQAGDPAGAVDRFMAVMVSGADWHAKIARMVPGGPEQAVDDAATFFEERTEKNGTQAEKWELDMQKAEKIPERIPILYMWGSETLHFLKEAKDLFRTWVPRTEIHRVDGVGHSLQMENPEAVADVIADFLRRHPI